MILYGSELTSCLILKFFENILLAFQSDLDGTLWQWLVGEGDKSCTISPRHNNQYRNETQVNFRICENIKLVTVVYNLLM